MRFVLALAVGVVVGCSASDEGAAVPSRTEPPAPSPSVPIDPPPPPPPVPVPVPVPAPEIADAGDVSMKDWKPRGKGLWIWHFDYIGMTPAAAAAKAADMGVGYVLIKSGQDASFWAQRFNASIVKEFTSRGVRVLAWPYVTPSDVPGAIVAAAAAASVPGAAGVVLDVEIEWENGGDHAAAAKALCEGIRAKAPGVWLGYTSFGWVDFHPAFPFAAFDAHCGDSAWPQVYYSDRGVKWDGPTGLDQAISQYKGAGLKAPMWPIQSNDDVSGSAIGPMVPDLNGFFDKAGAYASLWEFPEASRTAKLAQLPSLNWKNP